MGATVNAARNLAPVVTLADPPSCETIGRASLGTQLASTLNAACPGPPSGGVVQCQLFLMKTGHEPVFLNENGLRCQHTFYSPFSFKKKTG